MFHVPHNKTQYRNHGAGREKARGFIQRKKRGLTVRERRTAPHRGETGPQQRRDLTVKERRQGVRQPVQGIGI